MHSGNIGHAQDLETRFRAGALLAHDPTISIVLVGLGARDQEYVRLSESCGASTFASFPISRARFFLFHSRAATCTSSASRRPSQPRGEDS